MAYKPNDHHARRAKKEGFAARSVFKLQEIDAKFHLLERGQRVLDLGCAPGSWSQYAMTRIGTQGKLLGLDLKEVLYQYENAVFVKADIYETDIPALAAEHGIATPFDLVISDMAPKTTGYKGVDKAKSAGLCEMALLVAMKDGLLRPGGHFVCKIFDGPDLVPFRDELRKRFAKVGALRPESTRSSSTEVFLVGMGRKPDAPPYPETVTTGLAPLLRPDTPEV